VELPYALERKYPNANRSWVWQFMFPSWKRSVDPRTQVVRRHHLYEQSIQRSLKQAVRVAKIDKRVRMPYLSPQSVQTRLIASLQPDSSTLIILPLVRLCLKALSPILINTGFPVDKLKVRKTLIRSAGHTH
jgi:hypothetical protein